VFEFRIDNAPHLKMRELGVKKKMLKGVFIAFALCLSTFVLLWRNMAVFVFPRDDRIPRVHLNRTHARK
jgi:hypothetical protein